MTILFILAIVFITISIIFAFRNDEPSSMNGAGIKNKLRKNKKHHKKHHKKIKKIN